MRLWPFRQQAARYTVSGIPPDALLVTEDALRRNVEDLFVVRAQELRGAAICWGGDLRMEPARALRLLEARFKPFGYTPFLGREGDVTWIRALPLADVVDTSSIRVNVVLFLLTVLSTLAAGYFFSPSFPFLTFNPLVAILGTHEFGHYFTARHYGASVSLPYFIPAPPPIFIFGTLGAVIRMRSPARDRNSLFDIAVAGPLAGLVVALLALWLGLTWSRVGAMPPGGGMQFGDSLLMRFFTWLVFGSIPQGMDIFVHPIALAGWVGLFVTALNLIPVGQLDGGRIAYALFGARHRQVSVATFLALLALGAVTGSGNWFFLAFLLFFVMGFQHQPPLDDLSPLSPGRYAVGVACLILLVLLIPPVPVAIQ